MAFRNPANASGDWTNPANVTASDDVYATATATGKVITMDTFGFVTSLGPGEFLLIDFIELRCEAKVTTLFGPSPTMTLTFALSWDGGTSYTGNQTASWAFADGEVYKIPVGLLGTGNRKSWGRIWTPSELNAANFRARMTLTALSNLATASVDNVQVELTAHEAREMGVGARTNDMKLVVMGG